MTRKKYSFGEVLVAILFLYACFWENAFADANTIKVSVTVVDTPCDISGNQPISVEFGEMVIRDIDSIAYEQPIPYTIDCGSNVSNNQVLKLMFSGTSADFDSSLLKTTVQNLGLKLKANGQLLSINTPYLFEYSNPPELKVVPVKSGSGGVASGEFTASGTLWVEYQ